MSSTGFESERRHPRIEFHTLPWVLSLRLPEPAPADRPVRVEAKNVSRGGLKFFANRRFQLFEIVQVSLFEKGSGKPLLSLQGKVVRLEEIDTGFGERTYGVAMEFVAGASELAGLLPDKPASPKPEKAPPK